MHAVVVTVKVDLHGAKQATPPSAVDQALAATSANLDGVKLYVRRGLAAVEHLLCPRRRSLGVLLSVERHDRHGVRGSSPREAW
jgi:hypothetical protein